MKYAQYVFLASVFYTVEYSLAQTCAVESFAVKDNFDPKRVIMVTSIVLAKKLYIETVFPGYEFCSSKWVLHQKVNFFHMLSCRCCSCSFLFSVLFNLLNIMVKLALKARDITQLEDIFC